MARSIPAVRAPCVARDAFPRHGQHLRVAHQVVQIIKPASAVSARPAVQLVLHPPYRHESLAVARPRGGAGIHRRVFGPDSHSPAPFAVALPHVVGSPDLGVLRRLRPIDTLRPATRLSPDGERCADGSHVHCCSVDGRGARLCPCGLVVATPQTFTTTCQARHIHRPDSSPPRATAWLTAPGTVTHRTPAPIHRVRAGRRSRGFTTPVPHVHLPVSLTRHGPSGSAGPP